MSFLLRNTRVIFLILAIILALPVSFSFIGGLMWFSPFLFLITVLSSKAFVLLNLLGLSALVMIAFKRRLICKYICPLGIVCDQLSKIPARNRKLPQLRNFNKTLALFALGFAVFGLPLFVILDPFYIFQTSIEPFRTGFTGSSTVKIIPLASIIAINLFLPNSWCSSLCPLGGLQELVFDLRTKTSRKREISSTKSRRFFISSLAGLSLGILALPIKKGAEDNSRIRPPSALPESDYYLSCIRCGSCLSACPTNILVQQTEVNLWAFLAPAVDFSDSYCLPDCTLCGDVCPSGALHKFSLKEKKSLIMATVSVNYNKCLLYKQKECSQCQQYCEYGAVSYQKQALYMTPVPVFDKGKCVGCAACKIVCPESAIYVG